MPDGAGGGAGDSDHGDPGAPAIGVAAAMGIALGMRNSSAKGTRQFAVDFQKICDMMAPTRPTAVNLFWAIDRMKAVSPKRRRPASRLKRSPRGSNVKRAPSMMRTSPPAARWARSARRWCPTAPAC